MSKITERLGEVILKKIDMIDSIDAGSKEMESIVDDIEHLNKTRLDEIKLELAHEEELEKMEQARFNAQQDRVDASNKRIHDELVEDNDRKVEERNHREQVKQAKVDVIVRIATCCFEIVVPLAVYVMLARWGYQFEQKGIITSMTFRNFLSKLKPTMK